MIVDIWSDVRCPFCYIGKRKFEKALEQFPNKEQVEVTWHSFELDPDLQTAPQLNAIDHLAAKKGVSRAQAEQMSGYAAQAAKEIGLEFDFEHAVIANSFNAHRLIQLAKAKGLGSEAEELLFKAHFIDGKNIDDKEVLLHTGVSIGMDENAVEEALSSDDYAYQVRQDEAQARSLGIRGVPYFVFNDKYAVSGAQPVEVFSGALKQSWEEFEGENSFVVLQEGKSCSADGSCD